MKRLTGLLLVALTLFAAISFPKLTGRVVDNANLLTPQQEASITAQLAALENDTTDQLVVVTLPSLQGYDIAEYGYQLGRHWGIGQKGKDNGILLIVAPNERKVRIEVGYGLEGVVTDAVAAEIIQNLILPAFKRGAYAEGIQTGVIAIVQHLQYPQRETDTGSGEGSIGLDNFFSIGIFIFLFVLPMFGTRGNLLRSGIVSTIVGVVLFVLGGIVAALGGAAFIFLFAYFGGDNFSGGGWSSGGSSGGFSGGGSFGGGGASGSW